MIRRLALTACLASRTCRQSDSQAERQVIDRQVHGDRWRGRQVERETSENRLTKFFLIKSFLHLSRLLGRDWDLLSEKTLNCLYRDRQEDRQRDRHEDKSNQIKSNQIKSNQTKSIQIKFLGGDLLAGGHQLEQHLHQTPLYITPRPPQATFHLIKTNLLKEWRAEERTKCDHQCLQGLRDTHHVLINRN